jgi:NAD(P)-dependent dehydrogenase (short-subunit alcohol dehydrogenase family)
MPDPDGRTALVTGATSGIGGATALALAAAGATVGVSGRAQTGDSSFGAIDQGVGGRVLSSGSPGERRQPRSHPH